MTTITDNIAQTSNDFQAFRCYKFEGKVTKILIGECNSYDGAVDCIDQDREDFLAPTFWHFISSVAA
jgi:hypothetical protein